MTWTNNMNSNSEPIIGNQGEEDYTHITFEPDLKKFKMPCLDDDIVALMKKRAYDLAGVVSSSISVILNGKKIQVNSFPSYCNLYFSEAEQESIVKVSDNKSTNSDRWEVICTTSENGFQAISFVNSMCTSRGGTHVNYIVD